MQYVDVVSGFFLTLKCSCLFTAVAVLACLKVPNVSLRSTTIINLVSVYPYKISLLKVNSKYLVNKKEIPSGLRLPKAPSICVRLNHVDLCPLYFSHRLQVRMLAPRFFSFP